MFHCFTFYYGTVASFSTMKPSPMKPSPTKLCTVRRNCLLLLWHDLLVLTGSYCYIYSIVVGGFLTLELLNTCFFGMRMTGSACCFDLRYHLEYYLQSMYTQTSSTKNPTLLTTPYSSSTLQFRTQPPPSIHPPLLSPPALHTHSTLYPHLYSHLYIHTTHKIHTTQNSL